MHYYICMYVVDTFKDTNQAMPLPTDPTLLLGFYDVPTIVRCVYYYAYMPSNGAV